MPTSQQQKGSAPFVSNHYPGSFNEPKEGRQSINVRLDIARIGFFLKGILNAVFR